MIIELENDEENLIGKELFEKMALDSRINLEILDSQDCECFTDQFYEDPK